MRVFKLKRENFLPFLKGLEKFGELWGPVKKGENYVYAKEDPEKFELKALRTIIPAKKFFIPKNSTILKFKNGEWKEHYEVRKRVIFGLHPCELNGLNIYHRFYTRLYPDPYYLKARENTLIVGLSCMPDDKCFCFATKTSTVDEGFDLFLTDLEDKFLLWIGSPKGEDAIRTLSEFLEEVSQKDIDDYIAWRKRRDRAFKLDIDLEGMPEIVTFSYDSPIWEKMGDACLSCGTCTMVCPTCTCFDIDDEYDIRQDEMNRQRFWYSCVFREYSMVAGGHNFREAKSERLKLWYTHKLVGFMSEYGSPACVGCGRCIASCPVGINVLSVVKALRKEKTDAFWKRVEVKNA
ncbi:MAG: 4Fe-4S dicluster domain-containing protein [Candidatus Aminicenantes bacterium]|nr:4Fe-4S dicluster domain-containing protein [Candidatus Aminicenantes bacterium]